MRGFLLAAFVLAVYADDCTDCLSSGKHFCATASKCNVPACPQAITRALNCPRLPKEGYGYNDTFVRNTALVTISAAYNDNPQLCFNKQLPSMKVSKIISVNCSAFGPQTDCFGYTAVDTVQRVILMTFRGTLGDLQLGDELDSFFRKKKPFFDSGNILEYFYDGFMFMWNGGMQADIRQLKFLYPGYTLWVHGHSLGGAMASVGASYVVKSGLFDGKDVKLITFGQPRTGDYAYADWHETAFPYSYRVIHHKDITPHIPPQEGADEYFHHRTEVWYNNDMLPGQPFTICKEADGLFCSATQVELSVSDHTYYFGKQIIDWAMAGCP
ncbi:unnamed protein product [Caenorhabditis auriculariae]|uniref:Fungal lipase-type domain-containing protein n=1 Tax=Caenorhabditis auriculariae TaxID=2777116 RepID=A0A8S1HGI5_9PELO|nr:unnamed protein product [Caenorhabditis auriculariae]